MRNKNNTQVYSTMTGKNKNWKGVCLGMTKVGTDKIIITLGGLLANLTHKSVQQFLQLTWMVLMYFIGKFPSLTEWINIFFVLVAYLVNTRGQKTNTKMTF